MTNKTYTGAALLLLVIASISYMPSAGAVICDNALEPCEILLELNAGPEAPDLCQGNKDTWKKVYEVTPDKDALMVLQVDLSDVGDIGNPNERQEPSTPVQVLKAGELSYHAEIWKCNDYNGVNEVMYLGYKYGFTGSGLGWSYGDNWGAIGVECYYAVSLDIGQVPCEAWANSAPVYATMGSLTIDSPGSGISRTFSGPVQWDTCLAPVVGGLCWIGDFEGVAGVDVASAKFLGYL